MYLNSDTHKKLYFINKSCQIFNFDFIKETFKK